MPENKTIVPDLLKQKIDLFIAKGKEYNHTYKQFGDVWEALFPNGYQCKTAEQANFFGIYHMLIHKLIRLAGKLDIPAEISIDSAKDIQVYGAMLEELIIEAKERNKEEKK